MIRSRDAPYSALFRDKVELPEYKDLPKPVTGGAQNLGKKCKLTTNCFSITMSPNGNIYHYTYSLKPPAKTLAEEEWVIRHCWDNLSKNFNGVFIVRSPGHIFTPQQPQKASIEMKAAGDKTKGYDPHTLSVHFVEAISADQVNKGGNAGLAGVVFQHVVKRLAGSLAYQKVGRRYYDAQNNDTGKAQLMIVSSFYAGVHALDSCGPLLQIDTLHRAAQKRNILEYLQQVLQSVMSVDDIFNFQDEEVLQEWRRRCIGATVATTYNNKFYRIKAVDFKMTPSSQFQLYQREEKKSCDYTYTKFYSVFYNKETNELRQPMLVAYPEKDSEEVHLVPEFCMLIGLNDDMRKDKNISSEALKQTKVAPNERFRCIVDQVASMKKGQSDDELKKGTTQQLLKEWKLQLNSKPVEVEATIHDQLEISFGATKYPIEEGSFQKWMRNGLIHNTRLEDWLFIYPESDVPVLDIWLRSLRDIAQVAFAMKMADPVRLICTDQRKELGKLLAEKLTPSTQLVLLLTPQKDAKKVYQIFKHSTIAKFPCITQVVKSETIRKRQSIAAVLSKIVLQINAKFCGPLWSVDLQVEQTAPAMQVPTMVIGLDVFEAIENDTVEHYVGFAASLDTHCAEYFSTASKLESGSESQSMSEKIQEFLLQAVEKYAEKNSNLLPEHFVVYRASVSEDQWSTVKQTEVAAINHLLKGVSAKEISGGNYEPKLTFIAISKYSHMRFFHMNPTEANIKNPEPGTMIESPSINRSEYTSFYLVNQAVSKGTACPTHYVVLHDTASMPSVALQSLSYRLSYLYFNYNGSIKIPAPAQYAKKIAHLIGTAVKTDPNKRLLSTFFYL